MGIDIANAFYNVNQYLQIGLFNRAYELIINSIKNSINNKVNINQEDTTIGNIKVVLYVALNFFRVFILGVTMFIIIIINVVLYIVSNFHRWILLGSTGVFALCLYVVFYLWDIIRSGINGTIIPGINGFIQGFAYQINRLVKGLKSIGIKLDEMNDRGIEGEVPSLPGIAKALATPLLQVILSPLKAGPDDYK